jgi:hypothetical protein
VPSQQQVQAAIDEAVQVTFESMCFLEPQLVQGRPLELGGAMWVSLSATAPLRCEIAVAAEPHTVAALHEVLYAGEEMGAGVGFDVLAELLNVMAGRFLTELDDSIPVAMGLPQAGAIAGDAMVLIDQSYVLDSGAIRVQVRGNGVP